MKLDSQKKLAKKVLKAGISRVKIKSDEEVEKALTREDIRRLIRKGLIWKEQKKGQSKVNSKKILKQKRKGRRKGHGSRKGRKKARTPKKEQWMKNIRALRKVLKELRDSEKIEKKDYRKVYLMAKGGAFKTKKHLLTYLKENELIKVKK